MPNLRELVDEKVKLLRDINTLDPQDIAREAIELSSLLSSINKELVDRRMWFAEKKKMMLEEHKTAAKATIYAEASPEYRSLIEADSYSKSVLEMIRSCKKFLTLMDSERRESMYH